MKGIGYIYHQNGVGGRSAPCAGGAAALGPVMVVESGVDGLGRDVDLIEGLDLFEVVAACVAEGLLYYVVGDVPEEVTFNVCFVEDAPSVLDYQRRAD